MQGSMKRHDLMDVFELTQKRRDTEVSHIRRPGFRPMRGRVALFIGDRASSRISC